MPKQMDQPKPQRSSTITWEAPEFQEYRKHPLWFAAVALVTAALVLYGVFTESWTAAVVFGLAGFMAVIYAVQRPRMVEISLTPHGVEIGPARLSYREITKFWIVYSPPEVKVLYLQTKSLLNHIVKVELDRQDPVAVRAYLKEYAVEDLDQDESLVDIIARKVRF